MSKLKYIKAKLSRIKIKNSARDPPRDLVGCLIANTWSHASAPCLRAYVIRRT